MIETLKKHGVKIFVFLINVLLMAVAILVIRVKDQGRLLEQAKDTTTSDGAIMNDASASFEGQAGLSTESSNQSTSVDSSAQDNISQTANDQAPATPVVPEVTNPAPTVVTPNRQTKTS
jgi:hypothetical protein